ncbi:MAG: hypothetical protein WC213_00270 [Arenimonas sp.]|jgi:hypothetical protein
MPSFELKSPDGKVFDVVAPDAKSAVAAFQKMIGGQTGPQSSNETAGDTIDSVQASTPIGDQLSRIGSTLDSGARMIANGATFGLADKFAGGMNYLTGQAPSYDAGVKSEREKTQAVREAAPVGSAIGEGVGGVLSGAGLMKSGLTLAGRVGPGLLARVMGYGAEGAGYGAAQGAGNTYSDKISDYFKNAGKGALTGSAIGAGLPVVGSVAGAGYRAGSAFLGPRVEGAGRGASALLRGAAQADEAGLRNLGQLGDSAMLPDAGPAMLGLGQGAGTGTGAGRSELVNALRTRDQETATRLSQSLDTNLGPAPIPSRVEAGLAQSREALGPAYGQVLDDAGVAAAHGAPPMNTQALAQNLDAVARVERGPAQRAARQVREMLNDGQGGLDRSPDTLLNTRQAIDGMLTTEVDPNTIRILTRARQAVDAELANVPGLKDVDAQFAELSRQSAGLQRGSQVLDSGKTAIRPTELADEMTQAALPQGAQIGPSAAPIRVRQGTRADIDRRVGTNINDLNQLEKTFATPQDWNYQKLGTVFGEGPRDRVAGDISANRQFRDTYQKIVQNSQTAQRTEAADAMKGAAGGNIPTDITATSLGLKAANAIAKLMSGQSNATTKDQIGRILAQQGPEARRVALMLLGSAQTTGANARAVSSALSSPLWIGATAPAAGRR